MQKLSQNFFLYMAKNQTFNNLAKKHGFKFGAKRFVAGATIEEAIHVLKKLNEEGKSVAVDHLGEFVTSEEEANEKAQNCLQAVDQLAQEEIHAYVSVKLTSLGLDISEQLCMDNMDRILTRAKEKGFFVRIDMEDYAHYEQTLHIYEALRKRFDNVGLVLQAYLYRANDDMQYLIDNGMADLRLVKGAYKESETVAYPNKEDVDRNFMEMIKEQLVNGDYTAVATHDDAIIEQTIQFVQEHEIPKDRFEFQMLYGIRNELQSNLVDQDYHVRVYVPYGVDWYGYYMRRLAERPANVGFVLKGMVKR